MIGGVKFKLTLSADNVPEKAQSFCLQTEEQRAGRVCIRVPKPD